MCWHNSSGLAEAALGEGTGAKLHKLSVKDIKYVSQYDGQNTTFNNKCLALWYEQGQGSEQ